MAGFYGDRRFFTMKVEKEREKRKKKRRKSTPLISREGTDVKPSAQRCSFQA